MTKYLNITETGQKLVELSEQMTLVMKYQIELIPVNLKDTAVLGQLVKRI